MFKTLQLTRVMVKFRVQNLTQFAGLSFECVGAVAFYNCQSVLLLKCVSWEPKSITNNNGYILVGKIQKKLCQNVFLLTTLTFFLLKRQSIAQATIRKKGTFSRNFFLCQFRICHLSIKWRYEMEVNVLNNLCIGLALCQRV